MGHDEAPRASADALLADAERASRGRLRLFLGAAPGVGKTYAMLQAARAVKADGVDVVVGLVETHGRAETEALVSGFEVLPRKGIPYRGRLVQEFDLEAALARRPTLLLVDEYAHSNVEGSRHPKRWQDVQDCLAAGINVWTTMNVQHVESLNDVVQRITGVRVRETVPDTSLQKADDILLIDLPPDELIRRLAEGKVYVQDTATRAMQSFFKPSNLTALRELALRRVAARVDSDLLERMQGGAIEGPWAAGERLLVCVGPDEQAERVVREARRLSDNLDARWFAATIERPGTLVPEEARARLDSAMVLAKSLGAETTNLVGSDFPGELLRFAGFENITQIVVGRAGTGSLWQRFANGLQPSLAQALVKRAKGVSIHVLTAGETPRPDRRRLPPAGKPAAYLTAFASVAVATVLAYAVSARIELPNISMLYLFAVLVPALAHGVWPAVFASVLSFVSYNFFFIHPTTTFLVARPHEFLALAIFLIIAVLISAVAGRAREQTVAATRRTRAARRLYEFTRTLSALPDPNSVAEAAAGEIHGALGRACVILTGNDQGSLSIAAAWPPEDRLDIPSETAARWSFDHDEPAGAGTATLPSAPFLFLPLSVPDRRIGVVGIEQPADRAGLDVETRTLLETLVEQSAAALLRATLSTEVRSARTATENERVRNILLASISHDFRTPLASMLGSATGLLEVGEHMSEEQRRGLLVEIRDEARHLDGMVRNLLSMTRLEAGALDLRRDWIDVAESLERAVALARKRGARQSFAVRTESKLPLVYADQTLVDQAIGNILMNAIRYAGEKARIELEAEPEGQSVVIRISDDGPGVSPAIAPQVFEKFARLNPRGERSGGESAGLGLAITRGIAEAHGGSVMLEPPDASPLGGATFTLRLPIGAAEASA